MRTRLVIIGVGYVSPSPCANSDSSGASCSGKTTLAKHLARILPSSLIIHQDDFAPASENVPLHAVHGVQDWDDPDTGIEWGRLRALLDALRTRGLAAADAYESYDYLNAQVDVPLPADVEAQWRGEFARLAAAGGEEDRIVFVLVDGFIMFYDAEVRAALDVKIMLRVPYEVLNARREARSVYVLQSEYRAKRRAVNGL